MSSDILGGEEYRVELADCIEHMHAMPSASVDMCVHSPPFPAVFAYSDSHADLGNSEDLNYEAPLHFSFYLKALRRVLKPGRVLIVHCTQIALLKRSGREGMFDFRGMIIRLAQRAGFIYKYDWLVRRNPQTQALRTHAHELQFAGLERDRANSRGCMGDYLIKFQAPGENDVPIDTAGEVSRDEWIQWAEACWKDIRETDTLNVKEGREESDVKHICPMALGIYERCIRLFSNHGEIILDPFAGIGSCGFVALGGTSPVTGRTLQNTRRFYGIEMKGSYHATAVRNCEKALRQRVDRQKTLFDTLAETHP